MEEGCGVEGILEEGCPGSRLGWELQLSHPETLVSKEGLTQRPGMPRQNASVCGGLVGVGAQSMN